MARRPEPDDYYRDDLPGAIALLEEAIAIYDASGDDPAYLMPVLGLSRGVVRVARARKVLTDKPPGGTVSDHGNRNNHPDPQGP